MDTSVIITCILSSTVAAAVITSIKELWIWRLNRKAKLADRKSDRDCEQESNLKEVNEKLDMLKDEFVQVKDDLNNNVKKSLVRLENSVLGSIRSDKVILREKITELGLKYVQRGEITFNEKKFLHEMWNIYHYNLDGNGDLDDLMALVDDLPLKIDQVS